jgi:predicted Fe-Mo cluster-binding NifX family protein
VKIAIPMFNSRVSPRFDFAPKVLIAKVENGKVVEREHYSLNNLNTIRRGTLLREQGVNVLICGGISNFSIRLLLENGIQVVPMIAGELEEVLNQFIDGHLDTPPMPFSRTVKGGGYRMQKGRCRGQNRNTIKKS